MLVNFLIGGAIFGYAAWALVRFINKSKQGKCAACDIQKTCSSQSNCQTSVMKNKEI
ncbi:FeoB-associated Cys-rich membrane protein [Bacillus marasmi]|uniref:FeoB-associated Cys-rich membrane protein n=1 Tax=Bacillus marasmi TaxID=1926279 RepID=UPI0011C7BC0A|nr:FeoB-associated Cys-rich membrane protein [Bacillus marasmi]